MNYDAIKKQIIGAAITAVPLLVVWAIITWYDVQNLKELFPLKQRVAVMDEKISSLERQTRAQWERLRDR